MSHADPVASPFLRARPLAVVASCCLAAACGGGAGAGATGTTPEAVAARTNGSELVALDLDALRAAGRRAVEGIGLRGDGGTGWDSPTSASVRPAPTGLARTESAPTRPLRLFEVRDASGQVCSRLPLPDDWQLHQLAGGRYELTAPGGVKANATESASYGWSDDPFCRETIQRTGTQLAPVLPLRQIVSEGLEPEAARQGYRLTDTFELPELQALWRACAAAMPATSSRRSVAVLGTDWQGPDGARSCIVLLQTVVASPQSLSWTVQTTELEAPAERFDEARRTWLDGLAHARIDERWQRAKGMELTASLRQIEDQGRRWMEIGAAQHRQRMADIAAAGQAALQAGRESSALLDRSHESFRRRSAAGDVGQARAVDGIHERAVVVDPQSGQRYEVEAGHRYYWSDGRGGYFGTDDPNLDPRLDPALRHLPWGRMDVQGR